METNPAANAAPSAESPATTNTEAPAASTTTITETQNVARRIREVQEEARKSKEEVEAQYQQELDDLVKWGWQGKWGSYADLKAAREQETLRDSLNENPEEAIQKLVSKTLKNDQEYTTLLQFQRQEAKRQVDKRDIEELHTEFPELKDKIKTSSDYDQLVPPQFLDAARSLYAKGLSPTDIFWKFNRAQALELRDKRVQQETISKIQANGNASPGSVSQGAETPLTISDADIAHPNQARLASDPAYFEAFRQALERKRK